MDWLLLGNEIFCIPRYSKDNYQEVWVSECQQSIKFMRIYSGCTGKLFA